MAKKTTGVSGISPLTVFDLAEGLFLGHALVAIERLGILDSLRRPMTLESLATKHGVDREILGYILPLLAARTKMIAQRSRRYQITKTFNETTRFVLLQYVGAYGRNAIELPGILRNPSTAAEFIDHEQHSRAFDCAMPHQTDALGDLVLQRAVGAVFDIGCGTGSLLLYLATRINGFRGWGIDNNPWMCKAARSRAAKAGKARRITILEGDSRSLTKQVSRSVADRIQAVTASGVANEFFSDGTSRAIAWLTELKRVFPGAMLFIEDYYGQLGYGHRVPPKHITVHDFVQVISGQGVPPHSLPEWKKIYQAAQCEFVKEFRGPKSFTFIHMVRL